ncbi:MAG TPA: hypothetical protein PLZ27_02635, partial [Bacillota bacterium]|nr:hypothetical protein [Bacillota bacterium]
MRIDGNNENNENDLYKENGEHNISDSIDKESVTADKNGTKSNGDNGYQWITLDDNNDGTSDATNADVDADAKNDAADADT